MEASSTEQSREERRGWLEACWRDGFRTVVASAYPPARHVGRATRDGVQQPGTSDSGGASATSLLRVVSNLVRWRRRKTFLVRHFGGQSRQGRQAAQGEQFPFSAVILQLQRRFRLRRRGHAHRSLIGPVVVLQECRRDWWARRSCEPARLPFAPHSDPRRAAPDQNPLLVLRL
jgi:hypothetical protein